MEKINTNALAEISFASPHGRFRFAGKQVSLALGREATSTDLLKRHPFDVEILRVPAGATAYPYHSHSEQWEFYHVIAGLGVARDDDGETPIRSGDAFLYKPGEAHQLRNDSAEDLVVLVVADNPGLESTHYPDSDKWVVRSPERRTIRSENLDYFDGEE